MTAVPRAVSPRRWKTAPPEGQGSRIHQRRPQTSLIPRNRSSDLAAADRFRRGLVRRESSQGNPFRRIRPRFFAQFQMIQPLDLHEAIALRDNKAKGPAVLCRHRSIIEMSSNQNPRSIRSIGKEIPNSPALA